MRWWQCNGRDEVHTEERPREAWKLQEEQQDKPSSVGQSKKSIAESKISCIFANVFHPLGREE
jgi:hypothetical protein